MSLLLMHFFLGKYSEFRFTYQTVFPERKHKNCSHHDVRQDYFRKLTGSSAVYQGQVNAVIGGLYSCDKLSKIESPSLEKGSKSKKMWNYWGKPIYKFQAIQREKMHNVVEIQRDEGGYLSQSLKCGGHCRLTYVNV